MAKSVRDAERLRESGIDRKGFGKTHNWKPLLLGSEFQVFVSEKLILPVSSWILTEHRGVSLEGSRTSCPRLPSSVAVQGHSRFSAPDKIPLTARLHPQQDTLTPMTQAGNLPGFRWEQTPSFAFPRVINLCRNRTCGKQLLGALSDSSQPQENKYLGLKLYRGHMVGTQE